ncbi:MAG TPA: PaaI family thioesterase [Candidatus Dormibacteraeota bacterium]|nr:PaaI family thioesterase [Candidatus Dormibacteraeota bacterium]
MEGQPDPPGQPLERDGRRSGFGTNLGMRVMQADAGVARVELVAGPDHLNMGGTVHGGVICTLVDVAVAVACHSMDSDGRRRPQATTELNVTFLRAAGPGPLACTARIRRRGRSLAVGEAEISDGAGHLIAVGRATYLVGGQGPRSDGGAADDSLDVHATGDPV